jgi:uncharacterized protein (TIGR00375 family)
MTIEEIAKFAQIKGLNVVGTGDFTHPEWVREIKETLVQDNNTGLYLVSKGSPHQVRFMLTTEVCTIFDFKEKSRKVHHVILAPSLEVVDQINERLRQYGNLSSDGRPILMMNAAQLVEEVTGVSRATMVFPAHAWTPWFSVFGAFSGFDSIDDCYQDMTQHIKALETGLSSDPPMNWRLSGLDRFALVSNSDCHSFWPWRIGREANVFELEQTTYNAILDAISSRDPSRFKFTIETDPAYGKYHWTGHRNCNVSMSSQEANRVGNVCPVCRRQLTKGVEQRVEELADRAATFKPEGRPNFIRLLPLSEIIATVLGTDSPSTQAVWKVYNALIDKFGNEYAVLMDAAKSTLSEVVEPRFADAIVRVREGNITVVPGFDGVYGKLVFNTTTLPKPTPVRSSPQSNLSEFW